MDGIHDLGGKQGYGPIDVSEEGEPFHEPWEGREWAIAQCARCPGITIDWWRHCRELIMPQDYLGRPYFDSWAQTDYSTFIEAGLMTLQEAHTGKAAEPADTPAPVMDLQQVLDQDRAHALRFDGDCETPVRFSIGQTVKTASHGHAGHTRLPQYARGQLGIVQAYHGAHVFPDLSARGEEIHQHLYSVSFNAADLWAEANPRDRVYLDLWESYLEAL